MKVAMISRSSMYSVKGGDTIQLLKTAEGLEKLGVKTSVYKASEKIPYQEYDLLHFFNIIRPADHIDHIVKSGKPCVVSTIYLDYSLFDRYGRGKKYSFLFGLAGKSGAEYLKNIFRFIRGQDVLVSPSYLLGHKRALKRILDSAAMLLPNSSSEYKRLQADTGTNAPFHVVPNGIDRGIFGEIPENIEREDKIICVAQIYGMKNQHMLIEASNELGIPLEIIGKAPPNHTAYYDYCRKIAGPQVTFTDHMPQEELVERYASARVHALPSWFETTGLTSLEAGAMGCTLVAGSGGDVKDYLGDHAFYCDPRQPGSIKDALLNAINAPYSDELRRHIIERYTWEQAAMSTLEAYNKILYAR